MKLKKILIFALLAVMVISSTSFAETIRTGSINEKDIINRLPVNHSLDLHNTTRSNISGDDFWRVSKSYDRKEKETFVKYLTRSWAKASSYTQSKQVSYSWSCSSSFSASAEDAISAGLSFTKTRTESYSVAITVDADKRKYSKLGFFADYKVYDVEAQLIDFWLYTVIRTETGELWEPTSETYLNVVYK